MCACVDEWTGIASGVDWSGVDVHMVMDLERGVSCCWLSRRIV